MFDLVRSDKTMKFAYILFTMLVFIAEFLVVITKLTWGKTNYERRVDMIEKIGQQRMDQFMENDPKKFNSGRMYPLYNKTAEALRNAANSSMIL